jgi:hypothetical protein
MLKAATAIAALIIAVSVASSHVFAKNGGAVKGPATSQVNKPVATAKTTNAKTPSKLMLHSVTGAHYKQVNF